MDNLYLIIGLVASMAMIIVIVVLALRLSDGKRRLEDEKRSKDEALSMQKEGYEARLSELKTSHEKALSELKAQQEKAVAEQVAAVRAEMTSRTEEILKAREESLKTSAEASIKSITGVLDENVKAMKEAFEKNKETQTATSASLKTQLADAVASLQRQTVEIGSKADSLASAMRGSNKIQGDWGEVVLENMLKQEGMKEGRDYDAQTTLRDEGGTIALSEDEKRLRPDFVLHYPDGFDIIVDSKVNLSAYYDWTQASDEASRNDAMLRHLRAVKSLFWDFWGLEFAGEEESTAPSSILPGRSLEFGKSGCVGMTWLALMLAEARQLRIDAILVPGHMFFRVNGVNLEPNREGYYYSDEEYRKKYADGSWSGYEFRPLYKKQFLGLVAFDMGNYFLESNPENALAWYKIASEFFPAYPGVDKNRRLAIEKVDPRKSARVR